MKASEIKVGGYYTAKISGRVVVVKVDAVREEARTIPSNTWRKGSSRTSTVYDVTNTLTGRQTTFRSAAKFRNAAHGPNFRMIQKPKEQPVEEVAVKQPKQAFDPDAVMRLIKIARHVQQIVSSELTESSLGGQWPGIHQEFKDAIDSVSLGAHQHFIDTLSKESKD